MKGEGVGEEVVVDQERVMDVVCDVLVHLLHLGVPDDVDDPVSRVHHHLGELTVADDPFINSGGSPVVL